MVTKTVMVQCLGGGAGHDVLDVGCGTGTLLQRLLARAPWFHAIGVDVSEGMLAVARLLDTHAASDHSRRWPLYSTPGGVV